MNVKNILTTAGSAFASGAMGFVATHMSGGVPTNMQAAGAFLGAAALGGLVAVLHLYTPVPGSPAAALVTAAQNVVEAEAAKVSK